MSEAKAILSKRGNEAVKAGRLFVEAICGGGDDLDDDPGATHAEPPKRTLVIIDAVLEEEGRKP